IDRLPEDDHVVLDQAPKVDHDLEILAGAGKGKELPYDALRSLERHPRSVEVAPRGAELDLSLEQIEVAGDRCEQVVEVVSDPPGERPQRLHLLELAELLLEPLALRDRSRALGHVPHDDLDDIAM